MAFATIKRGRLRQPRKLTFENAVRAQPGITVLSCHRPPDQDVVLVTITHLETRCQHEVIADGLDVRLNHRRRAMTLLARARVQVALGLSPFDRIVEEGQL